MSTDLLCSYFLRVEWNKNQNQLNFEHSGKLLIVGKAETTFSCQLTIDSLSLPSLLGCCSEFVTMMLGLRVLLQENM